MGSKSNIFFVIGLFVSTFVVAFIFGVAITSASESYGLVRKSPYGCYVEWQGKQYKFDCEDGK